MLLTVNRLGSTNISLRRLGRGLRRLRLSAGGCGGTSAMNSGTLARRPVTRHAPRSAQLLDARTLAHRRGEGVAEPQIGGARPNLSPADFDIQGPGFLEE